MTPASAEDTSHRVRRAEIALEPTILAANPQARVDFDPLLPPLSAAFAALRAAVGYADSILAVVSSRGKRIICSALFASC